MISIDIRTILNFGVLVVAAVGLVGCSSAQPTDDPGVDRMGRYILMSKGPEAEVAIGYRYAEQSLGSEWLLLEAAITSPPKQTARIQREKVAVKTPSGSIIPLATQREFTEDYGTLQSILRKAEVVRDPMNYWPPRKQICALRFFVLPGEGVSFDEVSVNDFRACEGPLLFKIPGGVQAGRYVLTIDLEESEIRVPITFED